MSDDAAPRRGSIRGPSRRLAIASSPHHQLLAPPVGRRNADINAPAARDCDTWATSAARTAAAAERGRNLLQWRAVAWASAREPNTQSQIPERQPQRANH